MNRRKRPVRIRAEDVVFLEVNNVLAIHGPEFSQNCSTGHNLSARRYGEVFNGGKSRRR